MTTFLAMNRGFVLFLGLLCVTGCQTLFGGDDSRRQVAKAETRDQQAVDLPARGLSPQSLSAGECGVFLWTRRDDPEFTFFSRSGSEQALVWMNETEVPLDRIGVGGDVFEQEFTQQDFKVADKQEIVRLSLTPGEKLVDGRRIPEATLRLIDSEGWETLMPLVGISACQPDS